MNYLEKLMPSISTALPSFRYEAIKSEATEKIINGFLNVDSDSNEQPILYHMLGIPGSGKTTFYINTKNTLPNHVLIDFDAIMESIPEYQEDIKKKGSVIAFQNWELPTRLIGYELLEKAILERKNIFLSHSGLFKAHEELMNNIKQEGYKTKMYYVSCDIDTAQKRAVERTKITQRHTPPEMIYKRHILLQEMLPRYKKLADEFYEISKK